MNEVVAAIEEELIRCIERGGKLPASFSIRLPSEPYNSILSGGHYEQDGGIPLGLAGHVVFVKRAE